MSVTASSLLAGFKPQFDRILVQKVVESIAPKSKGGILLPPETQNGPLVKAKVLAYGSGRRDATTGKVTPISEAIQKAKFIAFPTYSGFHFKSEEGDICLIREDEVVGVFNQ